MCFLVPQGKASLEMVETDTQTQSKVDRLTGKFPSTLLS